MPELPEVETIRRGLRECIVKRGAGKIREVKVFERKSMIGAEREIVGTEVKEIERKGKALIVRFKNGEAAIIHLRMTGQLVWRDEEFKGGEEDAIKHSFGGGHPNEEMVRELPGRHTRVEIDFERGKLFFNDQRKFGFLKIVSEGEIEKDEFLRKLGKEPWEMTGGELFEKLKRHKTAPIKAVILDQTVVAGLGNIYADEALYYAGIIPMRRAGEVSLEEAEKLLEGARVVMERSLEAGGSTIRNYVKSDGTRGDYLDLFAKVYGREGKRCEKCGKEIKKVKVGGRGTHYCSECQR